MATGCSASIQMSCWPGLHHPAGGSRRGASRRRRGLRQAVALEPDERESHQTNIIDSTGDLLHPQHAPPRSRCRRDRPRPIRPRAICVWRHRRSGVVSPRSSLTAVSVDGEFFDEEFFAFREDGDLAWRAQLMGWKCLYTPTAVAWHVRRVTPERAQRPAARSSTGIRRRTAF